jgi:hypothetical protein
MWIAAEFVDFFQPTIQPTNYDVLCDFRVFGSPRGLVVKPIRAALRRPRSATCDPLQSQSVARHSIRP